jgi:hypothetical protein
MAGILNHEHALGREAQAKVLALDTDMSVEQAAKVLAVSPVVAAQSQQASGNQFADMMGKLGNPKVGAGREDDQHELNSNQTGNAWAAAFSNVIPLKGAK